MLGYDSINTFDDAMSNGLATAIDRCVRISGDQLTAIPELTLHRRHAPTEEIKCIYSLGLIVVAQGSKQLMVGDRLYDYNAGKSMLTTIDTPVVSHVSQASVSEPFLAVMLALDLRMIMHTASEMALPPPPRHSEFQPLSIEKLEPGLLDALVRLVGILDEPTIAPQLAPLIQQEIIVRLLSGPHSSQLRHLVAIGPPTQQIAEAVVWIKKNYVHLLRVDDLAERVCMSPSTFRHHFRAVTGMSPLQYQKQLRLQEARQLMLNRNIDANRAAGLVGYESPSQFSREYTRLFGAPPQRDVRRMRQGGIAPAA